MCLGGVEFKRDYVIVFLYFSMFMGDGHRGPYLDPEMKYIGFNFYPKNGDLRATSITLRVEYA
jgi:hypothetical protein